MIEVALHRALLAYAGKVDKGGQPYILHPLRLMAQVHDTEGQCVALLHDVIEDSDITADDLRSDGFPESVVSAVEALTKRQGEAYETFIERVRPHPLARRIKLLDIKDNLNLLRLSVVTAHDLERVAKYHRAWLYLSVPETTHDSLPA